MKKQDYTSIHEHDIFGWKDIKAHLMKMQDYLFNYSLYKRKIRSWQVCDNMYCWSRNMRVDSTLDGTKPFKSSICEKKFGLFFCFFGFFLHSQGKIWEILLISTIGIGKDFPLLMFNQRFWTSCCISSMERASLISPFILSEQNLLT